MQFIHDIYAARQPTGRPVISFEFFTPKTAAGDSNLLERTLPALRQLQPDYCSVTYGAGGSTRDKTLDIVDTLQREHGLPTMAHLTCVNTTRAQIGRLLAEAKARGIQNILALRGDPPDGAGEFQKVEDGFGYASELVTFLRQEGGFSVAVAGFPEGHIACRSGKHADWLYLKQKVNCGADWIITQLFFDNADFYEFRDHLTRKLGVTVPIVPGIVSILSTSQIEKFIRLCGARIPAPLAARLEQLRDHDDDAAEFGIDYATQQCADLLRQGVPGLHFYTLNKIRATTQILKNLGSALPGTAT